MSVLDATTAAKHALMGPNAILAIQQLNSDSLDQICYANVLIGILMMDSISCVCRVPIRV